MLSHKTKTLRPKFLRLRVALRRASKTTQTSLMLMCSSMKAQGASMIVDHRSLRHQLSGRVGTPPGTPTVVDRAGGTSRRWLRGTLSAFPISAARVVLRAAGWNDAARPRKEVSAKKPPRGTSNGSTGCDPPPSGRRPPNDATASAARCGRTEGNETSLNRQRS